LFKIPDNFLRKKEGKTMFKPFSFLFMLFAIVFFMSAPVFSGGINTDAVGVMSQIDVVDYPNTAPGSMDVFEINNHRCPCPPAPTVFWYRSADILYNAIFAQSIPATNCRNVRLKGSSVRAGFWHGTAGILYNI
jgi:hypothetical protein